MKENKSVWSYPGARWWKFDFHTHTPASRDTPWAKRNLSLSHEDWLRAFMAAGIDCVAVTDHNSGAWIDELKAAYDRIRQQAEAETPPDGFRELTLFPGVEISVIGGFHLLAIFGPSATTGTINELLGAVRYRGTHGNSDGATEASATDVVRSVLNAGGIPIPAHSDQDKGLLRVKPGTRECALDPQMVRQVMAIEDLLAVEWVDPKLPVPTYVEEASDPMAKVLGSDCHSFQGEGGPGSRYTWIKMARPTLEGLRLALLDGNGVSVRRSDEGEFDPFRVPAHFVTRIEIESARFMGNGTPERLAPTPYYNALIGGRGTGKSTIVHALRLAYRREEELRRLGEDAEPSRHFRSFAEAAKRRGGDGALSRATEIRIELSRYGVMHRLRWRQDGEGDVVEEQKASGEWHISTSQAVTADRFPIRLCSQGQIAALAGEGRQALLDIIDEAAQVGDLHRRYAEARRTYFSQRARLRELAGRLAGRPELEIGLADLNRKLQTLAQSRHAEVLKAHQQALRQGREVEITLDQLQRAPARIESLAQDLLLDDWPAGTFDPATDQDAITWRAKAERVLGEAREALTDAAHLLAENAGAIGKDRGLADWRRRADQALTDHEVLQVRLAEQGVADPQAFDRLVRQRQQLEAELKELDQLRKDWATQEAENQAQWRRVLAARKAITRRREQFVMDILAENDFVRMEVIGFGFEERSIEHSLRELLEVQDERFEKDILQQASDGEPGVGLVAELARAVDRDAALEDVKQRLATHDEGLGGHFRNYLKRKQEKPEFEDHIRCWFPEDDLRIEYSRGDGAWSDITQGSQGQRSAALLAFLLAFGDEPLILDQPEDDLDNHLIYELIVRQIRENKMRRQLIVVTHNPNVVVNGDSELVHAFDFRSGQCQVVQHGALQEKAVREEVCRIMEGGREAFSRRWARLGREL